MSKAIDLKGLVLPQLVEVHRREDNPNIAEFRIQPLERGYGHTLGNAMRRCRRPFAVARSGASALMAWCTSTRRCRVVEDVHPMSQSRTSLAMATSSKTSSSALAP
jgi:hypothetical protein